MKDVVADIAADDSIRAFVLTSEGTTNFSVGMNLKEIGSGVKERGGPDAFFDKRLRLISRIETMGKPSVASLFSTRIELRWGARCHCGQPTLRSWPSQ